MATAFTAMNALKRSAAPLLVPITPSTWTGGFWAWIGGWRRNLAWTILYVIRRNPANMTRMRMAATTTTAWLLSVPIVFRSNVAVGWAGSPLERMVAPAGPTTPSIQVWASGGGPSDVSAVPHFGPVDRFGGPWDLLYFAPMNFSGWSGNNIVYTTTVYLMPGDHELAYLAKDSNDYWAHAVSTSNGNF